MHYYTKKVLTVEGVVTVDAVLKLKGVVTVESVVTEEAVIFSCLSRPAPSVTRVCILARFVRCSTD